jgi:hypothetical protein
MDTQSLLAEAKARFAHNSAKHYLKEKYSNKLLIAEQGGLWRADIHTINFLHNAPEEVVLLDLYDNPVKVKSAELLAKLSDVYMTVMQEWQTEYKELENKR